MEKILRIEEGNFKINENDWAEYVGYQIITDQQTIKIGISDFQNCCESYGYLSTNDEINDFIGANLLSISLVDSALNNKTIEEISYLDQGDVMFVNFETSNGLFQLVVYNSHNGYYSHDAVIVSKQLNYNTYL